MPASTVTVYGIPNCDQVKKARRWLDENGLAYRFHDFKRDGLPANLLDRWIRERGWDALLNRKGTTWRTLEDEDRPNSESSARGLMLAKPSVIKRPVLEAGNTLLIGFDEAAYTKLL